MGSPAIDSNIDASTVDGFGAEWQAFDQRDLPSDELQRRFDEYFHIFRWDLVDQQSVGFDMGCGSGRWDQLLAPRVGHLHCIDPSAGALAVARRNLAGHGNVTFHNASVDAPMLPNGSMDFGVSIGVLHHVPDTAAAIRSCVELLKPGAPLLLYLYYRFDNRPAWFRAIWGASDLLRRGVSKLPFALRLGFASVAATGVYWPLARTSRMLQRIGLDVSHIPLSYYRDASFYTLRTDALDRFGTRLEHRFTREDITAMLRAAGCGQIRFSDSAPFWSVCAVRDR
jgi:SAM-dependent methyltransferase